MPAYRPRVVQPRPGPTGPNAPASERVDAPQSRSRKLPSTVGGKAEKVPPSQKKKK